MSKIFNSQRLKNKHNLPTLPVPTLETTETRMREWLAPFAQMNNIDFSKIQKDINQFMNSNDIKAAQEFLLNKSKDKNGSYLIDWWYDSYLEYQGININVAAGFTWYNKALENFSQIEKAAYVLYSISSFYLDLKVNPQNYEKFDTPKFSISLDQIEGLFTSYRQMSQESDEYHVYNEFSNHILFMYKNTPYTIQTIKDKKLVSLGALTKIIQEIIDNHSDKNETSMNFFELTDDRNTTSVLYSKIMEKNKEMFQKIKTSICAVCYDSPTINTKLKSIETFGRGNGNNINRWLGKSLNVGVNSTPHVTFTMEHTYYDGASLPHLMEHMNKLIQNTNFEDDKIQSQYELLRFNLTDEEAKKARMCKDNFLKFSDNIVFKGIDLEIGKKQLKLQGIKSADGLFQLVGQLAQFKTWKKMYSTYEAVDMRTYFRGRTECIRPLSNEIIDFSNLYFNNESNLSKALENVENAHYLKAKQCKAGEGIHRHLLGLKMAHLTLNKNASLLPVIDSDYYKEFSSNRMSTSTVGFPSISQFAFWPVQEDGFTMGYKIGKDDLFVVLTCIKKNKKLLEEYCKNFTFIFKDILKKISNQ